MKVLIVAAHPDDEVLGCGGTIARLASQGNEVHIAILGEGVTSRKNSESQQLSKLHSQTREAAAILGAKETLFLNLPDNRFDTVPLLEIAQHLEEHVARIRPEVVYTQHGGDLNIDHQLAYRATLTATRPMKGTSVKSVLAFEVVSSTEWAFQQFSPVFRPSVFNDISETMDAKLKAMQVYKEELRDFPHPRSIEGLRAQATKWGTVVGVKYAEAFELVREIR